MTKRFLILAILATTLGIFTGCSVDSTLVLEHPSKTKPGSVIAVAFSDLYSVVSNGTLLLQSVTRDSLHVAIGLPSGWSVESLDYYVVQNFDVAKYVGSTIDTAKLVALFNDSLSTYAARALPLAADAGMHGFFVNKIFSVDTANSFDPTAVLTSGASTTQTINSDSVPQWLTYSAKIGFSFPLGTRMDTTILIPDSLKSLVPSTIPIPINSIGVKMKPILLFAQLKAGSSEGDFKLYYFTKTGSMQPASMDSGSMTRYSINVNQLNSVLFPKKMSASGGILRFSPSPFTSGQTVWFTVNTKGAYRIGIYSVKGRLVQLLTSVTGASAVSWNGSDRNNRMVDAGTYLVRLTTENGEIVRTIQLIK